MNGPKTWAELVETFPLTLKEKLTGSRAKVYEMEGMTCEHCADLLIVVDKAGLALTDDEKDALLAAAPRWFHERFTLPMGKRYRGIVFMDIDSLENDLAQFGGKLLSVTSDWPEPTFVECPWQQEAV